MKYTIYYFTGTGNSYAVAKHLKKYLGQVKLIRITKERLHQIGEVDSEVIGVIYPVYFGSPPDFVKTFVKKLRIRGHYIFAVATCGGFSGSAHGQINRILVKKGAKLNRSFVLSMPANNQTSYPPIDPSQRCEVQRKTEAMSKTLADEIKMKVSSKKWLLATPSIAKIVIPPTSDRHFNVSETCDGCGICFRICPVNNITMSHGLPIWQRKCSRCTACLQVCPQNAIQYKKRSTRWGRYIHPDVTIKELVVRT